MAIDTASPRTRRALLAAALGAGAASVASALGRPLPVRAGVDGDVVLGASNSSNTMTTVHTDAVDAFYGWSESGVGVKAFSDTNSAVLAISNFAGVTATSGDFVVPTDPVGVFGHANQDATASGVHGHSEAGVGVRGESGTNDGVHGVSGSGSGVRGISTSNAGVAARSDEFIALLALALGPDYPAVSGQSSGGNTGVRGSSGASSPPATPTKTGVYGYAAQDASARGVYGQSFSGTGVYGVATTGLGVRGLATTGTGGHFSTPSVGGLHTGYALRADGRVKLDNCAGVAIVATGTKSVTVAPGIDLTGSSAVVASLMGSAGGTTTVHRSTVNPTANTFTIYLTANSTTNVKVAWHVFG